MDNKFENHVKSDKVKWIVVFLALILLAVGFIERQYGRLQSSASGQIPR